MTLRRVLVACLIFVPFAGAQPKKPDPKDAPRVLLAMPFGVQPGKATKVTLRGLKLDAAKEVRFADKAIKGTIKLLTKGKAGVPPQMEAARVGDTQVEIEITVPAGVTGDSVALLVVTPGGDTAPHKLLLDRTPLVQEKEPNEGFDTAQIVALGQTIEGRIERAQDVDVYAFEGKAGQQVALEVHAARHGGAFDSFLSLHDKDGQVIASNDDIADSVDSRIEATLAKDGKYFITVIDSHDSGGALYGYRLSLRVK
jgi:hypothetical protein